MIKKYLKRLVFTVILASIFILLVYWLKIDPPIAAICLSCEALVETSLDN